MTTNQCTARSKRTGNQCEAKGMPNGKCYHHGGASTGAPKGNQYAMTHGIYSRSISAEEADLVQTALGTLDQELVVARIQLRRALAAETAADATPDKLELAEITERSTDQSERRFKRRDYFAIINILLGRIESLEKHVRSLWLAARAIPR